MAFNHDGPSLRDRFRYLFATFMSLGRHGKMKIEKEKIREIVIISLEENEISLIRIKGKIDPNQMQNIIEDNA